MLTRTGLVGGVASVVNLLCVRLCSRHRHDHPCDKIDRLRHTGQEAQVTVPPGLRGYQPPGHD
ncbi:MAG: hypothetical protein RBT36_10255 [Desulfobulbus sp.]|nr:hypothetical protein [Desulfobulbus sp.]